MMLGEYSRLQIADLLFNIVREPAIPPAQSRHADTPPAAYLWDYTRCEGAAVQST